MSRPTRCAISRIVRPPAAVIAFRISSRLAVSTFQSSSAEAKEMRAAPSALPVFQARVAAATESANEPTSRTTVFMLPPRNIPQEICLQFLGTDKSVSSLGASIVAMVALAPLVVVSHHALAGRDEGVPVLVPVSTRADRRRDTPQDEFDELGLRQRNAARDQPLCLHVVNYTNGAP